MSCKTTTTTTTANDKEDEAKRGARKAIRMKAKGDVPPQLEATINVPLRLLPLMLLLLLLLPFRRRRFSSSLSKKYSSHAIELNTIRVGHKMCV